MLGSVFGDKDWNKKLFSLVIPIALQQLMLSVVSASDAVMLNLISQDKMAAVSLATQITFVENLFLAAMTIGLSMLAAQYWGKQDKAAVERIFAYVMKITTAVSLVFCMAARFCPRLLMGLLTNEPILIEGGAEYLRLVAPSYLLTGISQIALCTLKNSGRAKRASLISSVCMVGDMLMNIILIVGLLGFPRLEIAGAAISTTIARAAEIAWCTIEVSKKDRVKLRMQHLIHTDRVLRRDFWQYTTPVLGNEIVWGVGFTMFSVIMGHLGSDAVAANSIAGIFCAGGDSKFGFLCDTVVMWGIVVPLGALAAFVWHLPVIAVYLIVSLDELLKLPAVYLHYKKYKWVKDLTIKEENEEWR